MKNRRGRRRIKERLCWILVFKEIDKFLKENKEIRWKMRFYRRIWRRKRREKNGLW